MAEFKEYRDISSKEIMSYYKPKWLVIVGIISSIGASAQLPIFGYLLSQMVFILDNEDKDSRSETNFWVLMFMILCLAIFIFTFLQKLSFGYGAENLTNKIRILLFNEMLHKHIGWFDDKNRAPGILGNIIN